MSEWRRFERGSLTGDDDQFWSVRLRGRVCELRHGRIGDPPTEERRSYPRESAARRAIKQKISARLERGWLEIDEPDAARMRALEAGEPLELAIGEDLTRVDHWAVYADFLQQFEPLLGKRIALGLAHSHATSDEDRARLHAEIEQLERTHARELFGATLAGALPHQFFHALHLERRFGMIVGAWMLDLDGDTIKYDALAGALLDSPLARTLIELHVDSPVGTHVHVRMAETLASRRRPNLRRLTLGLSDSDQTIREPPLPLFEALLDRLPNLERLELHGSFRGAATHGRLRELKFVRPRKAPRLDIVDWRLAGLATLHLQNPGRVDWSHVELPRLERLLIDWDGHGDELVASLARAPLLRQLQSLVLGHSKLSDRGIQTMLDHAAAFAALQECSISGAVVGHEAAARLRRSLPNVQLSDSPRPAA